MSKKRPTPLEIPSPPHLALLASRRASLSPKLLEKISKTRRRERRTSHFLELPVPSFGRDRKKRVASLPASTFSSEDEDEDFYRLRHFDIDQRNHVVNCGDELLRKGSERTRSNRTSPMSSSCCNSNNSMESIEDELFSNSYRIVMLGEGNVGKTSLVNQFMTSEYISTYDASLDDEFGERCISVLLDDQESELIFIDHPSSEMSPENAIATYNPSLCIVVYSITDRHSFNAAEEIIHYLNSCNACKAIILVGNKCDLERAREVKIEEAKNLATLHSLKFIETSPGLQHNVDELLVGVLKQCRLREEKRKKKSFSIHELARELLKKMSLNESIRSRSCENLHIL